MSLAAYLANVLPAWIVAGSFVLLVYFVRGIMLELRAPRLAFAASPARPIAPVAPTSKPQPLTGRVDRISAPRSDVEILQRVGYIVVHEGRESVIMVKQLDSSRRRG